MAGEKNAPAAPAQGGKKNVIVFSLVAVVLLGAIIFVWVKETNSAKALTAALSTLQQDVTSLRQETAAKDRVVTDLITKIEASITSLNGGLKTLVETSAKQQEELTALRADMTVVQVKVRAAPSTTPGKDPGKDEFATMSQPELVAQLSALGDRIERLKTDVVLKETKILQTQITDAKGRIDKAEKDVSTLTKTIDEADLPSLKTKVQEVAREISQAEVEVKTLGKAHAEFKQLINGFFGEVFYNDPWGKYAPQEAAKSK
jgi:chromosome segregation ATPase